MLADDKVPISLLMPLLSVEDRTLRIATCHTLKRACILSGVAYAKWLHELMEHIPKLIANNNSIAEQESGYYLLHLLVMLKVPELNAFLMDHLLQDAIHLIDKSSVPPILRKYVLLFIESLLMVRPFQAHPYLESIRDHCRELLCHTSTASLLTVLSRVYTLVCYIASQDASDDGNNAISYFKYLKNDISIPDQWLHDSDPLLNNLSASQLKIVQLTTLSAMGAMHANNVQVCKQIIDEIIPYVTHADAQFRCIALEALNTQCAVINSKKDASNDHITAFMKWAILPLCTDLDVHVRTAFYTGALGSNLKSLIVTRFSKLTTEQDDLTNREVAGGDYKRWIHTQSDTSYVCLNQELEKHVVKTLDKIDLEEPAYAE